MHFRFIIVVAIVLTFIISVRTMQVQSAGRVVEWRAYAGDNTSSKHSPLDQINKDNVKNLRVAWRWICPDEDIIKARSIRTWLNEATPVMAGGVLYVSTSLSQAAAIDAATGKTLWVYDPKSYENGFTPTNLGWLHRGVAYWADGDGQRILYGTGDAYLVALNAKTGKPISTFGDNGRIDLTQGLRRPIDRRFYAVTSPPVICRDVVIIGSSIFDFPVRKDMPPGDVRGFDARTGKLLWTFRAIPQKGEFGYETWEGDAADYTGNANVWTMMSADDELGYVYLPMSTPSNDFYGGHRHGSGLFGECLVCIEAKTGKRVWHYQFVHHGVWDYDLPAAPNLVDITVGGKKIKAVAQVTKQGFCFVFDRVTGKPVWDIEERPVPQSKVSGEKTSPTQPFPTKPPPFDRQGVTENDVIDFTPELKQQALEILRKYDFGPLFTPPTEKGTIYLPGWAGGANWAGAAFDPETGLLYVPSITSPIVVTLRKPTFPPSPANFVGQVTPLTGPQGLPLFKPPFGRLTAIDLNKGEHAWQIPLGNGPRDHPALRGLILPPLGYPRRGCPLLTKTLLFIGQEGSTGRTLTGGFILDAPKFRALDKKTGKTIWEMDLPANATGAPMTYMMNGKQFIVVPIGGSGAPAELVALSLP
jgi:quinoprotein glucose dehydrogenase